jgi:Zn-dependent peptidase ImmA (M78 family)
VVLYRKEQNTYGNSKGGTELIGYISRAEADELCDGLIKEYIGSTEAVPSFVDIEGFIKGFLKCTIVYESIAETDEDRIGFTGDGKRSLRIRKNGRIKEVVYPRNTIVLDRYLLNSNEDSHRRFVLGHEAGHILVSRLDPDSPACFYHFTNRERKDYSIDDMRERYSINEWQANTIGAALLMPRYIMINTLKLFNGGRRLPVYGDNVFHPREKVILGKMADALRVSRTALIIRLRDLGMLNRHDVSEYIKKELRLGRDG